MEQHITKENKMPNHCTNNLTIKGNETEVKRFREAITKPVEGRKLSSSEFAILHNLYPCPIELEETPSVFFVNDEEASQAQQKLYEANIEKFGSPHAYDWKCEKWGTKWGDYDGFITCDVEPRDNGTYFMSLQFLSAWSPPTAGIKYVSLFYPTLEFVLTFEEGGMGFIGGVSIKNGETVAERWAEYPQFDKRDNMTDEQRYEMYEKQNDSLLELMDEITEELAVSF